MTVYRAIQPGELRHVGNLEERITGTDSTGMPSANFRVWAQDVRFSILDWKSPEDYKAEQVGTNLITRLIVLYRPGIVATMRMAHCMNPGDSPPVYEYYDITGVTRDPTLRWSTQLNCILRDAAGFRAGAAA